MVTVPALTPVTVPDALPTVAFAVLLLLHVPPLVAFAKVVVLPVHVTAVPVITAGIAFTVTSRVLKHPTCV